jgi:hypothetical protein
MRAIIRCLATLAVADSVSIGSSEAFDRLSTVLCGPTSGMLEAAGLRLPLAAVLAQREAFVPIDSKAKGESYAVEVRRFLCFCRVNRLKGYNSNGRSRHNDMVSAL